MNKKKTSCFALLFISLFLSACNNIGDSLSSFYTDLSSLTSSSLSDSNSSSEGNSSSSSATSNSSFEVFISQINVNEENVSMYVGDQFQIETTVLPSNATNKELSYQSSNTGVVTVNSEGLLEGVAVGNATITIRAVKGEASKQISVTVKGSYNITLADAVASSGVEVSCSNKAKEGELVEVTLTYDNAAVEVLKVTANNIECGTRNGKYYFYMPAEDVEINLETSTIGNYFIIENASSDVATLHGNLTAEKEDEVSLSFSLKPGYVFTGEVKVYTGDNSESGAVECTVQNGVISFQMPEGNVKVEIGVTGAYFQVTKSDDEGFIKEVKLDGTVQRTETFDAMYGSEITITFKQESDLGVNDTELKRLFKEERPSGISIPEMNQNVMVNDDSPNSVTFEMPYYDVSMEVLTATYYRNFTITNSTHITAEAYKKVDENYVPLEEDKAVYGDTIYLKAESDSADYAVRKITAHYTTQGSNYSSDQTLSFEDGYYKLNTMPEVKDGTVLEFNVEEKNMTTFAGRDFLGDYKGYSSAASVTELPLSIHLDGSGIFNIGGGSNNEELSIQSAENNEILIHNEDSHQIKAYYDDQMFIMTTLISTSMDRTDLYPEDAYFFFKVSDSENLTVYSQELNGGKYHVGQVYKDSEPYLTYLMDAENDHLYKDVEFRFEEGTHVTDDSVDYSIYSEDELLLTVSGSTASTRTVTLPNGFEGTYRVTAQEKDLVVYSNKVKYDNHVWEYQISDDDVGELKKKIEMYYLDGGTRHSIVATLNTQDSTATLEEEQVIKNEVYGKAYRAKSSSSSSYWVFIYFDNLDTAHLWGDYGYSPSNKIPTFSSYEQKAAKYTYDSASKRITFEQSGGNAVLELQDDGSLKVVDGTLRVNGSYSYYVDTSSEALQEITLES